jgi:predicted amidohydrolase YtcJ
MGPSSTRRSECRAKRRCVSYTLNAAYAAFEEDRKGSLAVGKLADITVLSQDILTIAEDQIPATQVDYTVVGGKIQYKR